MLRRSAEALQGAAKHYLDERADPDWGSHWSFDSDGHGTRKTGADRRAADAMIRRVNGAIEGMPVTEALAADIARTVGELEALQTRIEELRKVHALPAKPPGVQCVLEDDLR
jgi:hypothetical protein